MQKQKFEITFSEYETTISRLLMSFANAEGVIYAKVI